MGGKCILASSMAKGRRRLASSLGWKDWVRGVQQKIISNQDIISWRRTGESAVTESAVAESAVADSANTRRSKAMRNEPRQLEEVSAVAESANTRKKAIRTPWSNEPRQMEEVKGCDGVAGSGQVADKCGVCGGAAGVGGGGAAGAAYVEKEKEKESMQLRVKYSSIQCINSHLH